MVRKIGIACIVLGVACMLTSVGFVVYNRWEASHGERTSLFLLQDLHASIPETELMSSVVYSRNMGEYAPKQMLTVSVGNYDSIGILSIPVLELELPVLADWSYEKLKNAPCHYYGSCYGSDFVIAAHNYPSHFGRLSQLQQGDLVIFTDVSGGVHAYEVVLLETLLPTATEEMITSGFDLSLYTCTPGGSNRVTVRCNAVKETGF